MSPAQTCKVQPRQNNGLALSFVAKPPFSASQAVRSSHGESPKSQSPTKYNPDESMLDSATREGAVVYRQLGKRPATSLSFRPSLVTNGKVSTMQCYSGGFLLRSPEASSQPCVPLSATVFGQVLRLLYSSPRPPTHQTTHAHISGRSNEPASACKRASQ